MVANTQSTEINDFNPTNDGETPDPEKETTPSFEELLDAYDYDMPHRGQILEGVVLEADEDEVLVDVGLKRDAIVTRKDLSLLPDHILEKIEPGAQMLLYVLQPRNSEGELIVSINKALELEDWERARQIKEEDGIVDANVVDMNKGGLLVDFGRLTGFVPQSHIISLPRFASQDELHEAKRDMIGEVLPLKFIEIDRRRNRLIMSERAARIHVQQTRLSELEEGQVIKGRVVSIVSFGAFVDLGGVDGLIHISKLAHHHVNHPGEILAVGDEVEVLIDNVDRENQRISLDRSALLPDPWDEVTERYSVGDLVEGTVTNVVDFGAFVQLPDGLQGLVHVSEMTMFGTSNPRDLLREGDPVLVRIVSIEPERERIGLSMDDVTIEEQEEWMHKRREAEGIEEDVEDEADVDDEEADVEDEVEDEDEDLESVIAEAPSATEADDEVEEVEAEIEAEEAEADEAIDETGDIEEAEEAEEVDEEDTEDTEEATPAN